MPSNAATAIETIQQSTLVTTSSSQSSSQSTMPIMIVDSNESTIPTPAQDQQSTPITNTQETRFLRSSDTSPIAKIRRIVTTNRQLNTTYMIEPASEINSNSAITSNMASSPAVTSSEVASTTNEFTNEYRLILDEFLKSNEQQYACPSSLTKEERCIVHKLADEMNLQSQSKGNWKKKILYIYKNQLNLQDQRNSQAISTALQRISSISQPINQNVLDVVDAA